MLKEFKEFAMRGNVVDMAIGIIIGAAFGAIVKSMVDDVIMPPIGLLLGNVDFSNLYLVLKTGATAGPFASLAEAKNAGAVTINYGVFANQIISFFPASSTSWNIGHQRRSHIGSTPSPGVHWIMPSLGIEIRAGTCCSAPGPSR